MSTVTFLPDWFGTDPPIPCEYQANPRSVVDRDTGQVNYIRDSRTGLVWWFCEFTQPGKQVTLGFLAEQLAANPSFIGNRLARLVASGEVTREQVTNWQLQQVEKFAVTDFGRQRLAEFNATIADD